MWQRGGKRFSGTKIQSPPLDFPFSKAQCRGWRSTYKGKGVGLVSLELVRVVPREKPGVFLPLSMWFMHSCTQRKIISSRGPCSAGVGVLSFLSYLIPHEQLFFTSVRGLLVLYLPLILFILLIPSLKIAFFLPIMRSLLSSFLFCANVSLLMSFSAFRISSVRRLVQFRRCQISFWIVCFKCVNPSPCLAFQVALLV